MFYLSTPPPPSPLSVSFSAPGLVATIKERITKPTAMAQGRVAHLIEWKGWGGGGGEAGRSWTGGWSKAGGSMAAGLHEDEQFYSQMTDEIKEARFAAGEVEGRPRFWGEKPVGGLHFKSG